MTIESTHTESTNIETTRFGALNVESHKTLTFPEGLPGFESCRLFTVLPHHTAEGGKGSPFVWLQSLERGDLAFLAIEPHQVFPDYAPRVPRAELESLSLTEEAVLPRLYSLLTVPHGDPAGITANLMAPILINSSARVAKQVVLNTDQYGLRHRLIPAD
ncbi:MAG: flagellar assembly protein FliW [Janthinobacterium lividum]